MVDGSTAAPPPNKRDAPLLQERYVDLLPRVLRARRVRCSGLSAEKKTGQNGGGEGPPLDVVRTAHLVPA
jgi:hypothetical protein